MKYTTLLFIFIAFIACTQESTSPSDVGFGADTELSYLKTITINKNLKVSYASFQESRCPKGVTCIRQGGLFATISLENTTTNATSKVVFCVSGECLSKKSTNGLSYFFSGDNITLGNDTYKVFIKEFTPKDATQTNDPSQYSLKINISK